MSHAWKLPESFYNHLLLRFIRFKRHDQSLQLQMRTQSKRLNTPNSSIVKSPIKFMFLCACVNYVYKLIPIKSAIEIPLKIAIFNAIF